MNSSRPCPHCGSPIVVPTCDDGQYRCASCGKDFVNGTRRAATAAHGRTDPSSGDGTGASATNAAAGKSLTLADLIAAHAKAAAAAYGISPGYLAAKSMGVPALAIGSFMQPHPLARPGAITWLVEKPRSPLETAPISVGEFVGWRVWLLRPADRLLQSYSAGRIWLPGEPMTGKPSDHGGEGVWAFKDANRAADKLASEGLTAVLGSVWLWGQIIEHTEGYRAELAEIRSIDYVSGCFDPDHLPASPPRMYCRDGHAVVMPPGSELMLAALRERYGVGSAAGIETDEAA